MAESKEPKIVLWQKMPEDGVSEPALAFKRFIDVIEIRQEDRYIMITPEAVPDICRILRQLQPEPKEARR